MATRAAQSDRNFGRASGHSWTSDSSEASGRGPGRQPGAKITKFQKKKLGSLGLPQPDDQMGELQRAWDEMEDRHLEEKVRARWN